MNPRILRTWILSVSVAASPAFGLELPSAHPTTGTVHRWVSLPATMAAFQQVTLQARVAGYVKSVSVDKGDEVKAGQTLAVIEVPEIESDLIKVTAEQDAAAIELKRLREARAKSPDLVLPQTVDNAEARFTAAKAGVDRCQTLLDFAQIKAPFAGTITARSVDPGAYVAVGGSPLLRLVDSGKLRCQIPVTEMETPLARVGKPVKISVDALPGQSFEASVTRISQALDLQTRTMLIEADLENAGAKILAGMSATAKIGVERHEQAVLIPTAALVMEKTNAFVFKHQGGKAVKTQVKLGFNDGTNVEVPELKPDDVLLVVGTAPVADGQEVKIKAPEAGK
jgi:membrane fusion protein (multidrug efflux system)